MTGMTRREAIALAAVGSAQAQGQQVPDFDKEIAARYDKAVEDFLKRQNMDAQSRGYGSIPDETGLYFMGTAAGIVETFANVSGFVSLIFQTSSRDHYPAPAGIRKSWAVALSGVLLLRIAAAKSLSSVVKCS